MELLPYHPIAQGQAQSQKGNVNAGTVLGVDFANIGAAFVIIFFAALLV